MSVVLGLDVGTHGVRSLAVDAEKQTVLASAGTEYHRIYAAGVQEMNPPVMLKAVKECLASLFSSLPSGICVEALGITHQRGSVIPVDGLGNHLGPVLCDSDSRAASVEDLAVFTGLDAPSYYSRTGCPFVSFNGLAKVLWARRNLPELYRQAAAWLSPQDYLISQLTGKLVLTEGSALRNGVLSVRERELIGELLPNEAFLKHDCIPIGKTCGRVSGKWSEIFKELEQAQVIAVPGDQPAAVIGTGAAGGHDLAMNMGTTFVVSQCGSFPALDPECMATVEVLPQGRYALEFGTGAGSQFLEWVACILTEGSPTDSLLWKRLDAEAAKAPPGSEGLRVVPLMWQVTSPGVTGRISQLGVSHGRAHLIRAVYEGLACEARIAIEKVESCTGITSDTLRVFGGASSNENFLKILSVITQKRVLPANEKQASAFGAALVASAATGHFETVNMAPAEAEDDYSCYLPESEKKAYDGFFGAYCTQR